LIKDKNLSKIKYSIIIKKDNMSGFKDLYNFLEFAKNNRKYPESTANNIKSALKIFEKELTENELNSINLVEDTIEEIFLNVVSDNKEKNIGSLNAYKARVLKIIKDYKKYGVDPSKIQGWQIKTRKSTPLLNQKDKKDKNIDNQHFELSNAINNPVHKIDLSLKNGKRATITLPDNIDLHEAQTIKAVVDALVKKQ